MKMHMKCEYCDSKSFTMQSQFLFAGAFFSVLNVGTTSVKTNMINLIIGPFVALKLICPVMNANKSLHYKIIKGELWTSVTQLMKIMTITLRFLTTPL